MLHEYGVNPVQIRGVARYLSCTHYAVARSNVLCAGPALLLQQ